MNQDLKVLLIDDQPAAIQPLNVILANLGIQPTIVFDGFSARREISKQKFDLIIIDWNMPDLNGAECLSFSDTTLYLQPGNKKATPYVTYSGLEQNQLDLPNTVFFRHVGHWPKVGGIAKLTQMVLNTLNQTP